MKPRSQNETTLAGWEHWTPNSSAGNKPEVRWCLQACAIWRRTLSSPKRVPSPVCISAGGDNRIVLTTADGLATTVLQCSSVPRYQAHRSLWAVGGEYLNWSRRDSLWIVASMIQPGSWGEKMIIRGRRSSEGGPIQSQNVRRRRGIQLAYALVQVCGGVWV